MDYYLYPPFFRIEPQTSFGKAWEDFCCRLLNVAHQTTDISVREPPDRGIDLFWPSEGIAYQCKAVESGISRDFKTDHTNTSFKKAWDYRPQIRWQQYVLCTNVSLTGPQEEALLRIYPEMKILSSSYWIELCRRFHEHVADRFQLLIPIAPTYVHQAVEAIKRRYGRDYLPQMREYAQEDLLSILLYSNKHKHIFEFSIPSAFTVQDVLLMLRELFELPAPRYIHEHNVVVSLEHSLHVNNKEVAPQQKLREFQIGARSLVTLWKTITWSDNGRSTQTTDLEGHLNRARTRSQRPLYGPPKLAVDQYTREVDAAIDRTINRFRHE